MSDYVIKFNTKKNIKPLPWRFFTEAAYRTIAARNEPVFSAHFASRDLVRTSTSIQKKQWAAVLGCSTTKIGGLCYDMAVYTWDFSRYQPDDRVIIETLFCLDAVPTYFDWTPSDQLEQVVATEIYNRFLVFTQAKQYERIIALLASLDQQATDRPILTWQEPSPFTFAGELYEPMKAEDAVKC